MAEIVIIRSDGLENTFLQWLEGVLSDCVVKWLLASEAKLSDLSGQKVLLIAELNTMGYCMSINEMLLGFHQGRDKLDRPADVAVVLKSPTQFYTKSYGRYLGFQLSQLGCRMLGKPLLELLPGYENLRTWQKVYPETSLEAIATQLARGLVDRLLTSVAPSENKHLLVIHASEPSTSNTVALWRLVAEHLKETNLTLEEIGITRGSVTDCIGCDYAVCMRHAQRHDCVVGGVFVQALMPAIHRADVIVWLCPNYNDAISADLMAVINRMSGIYRFYNLYEKRFYAVVVSGNSGGDAVAMQLIDGLNLNKGFILPPHFLLSAIANAPLSILNKPGIEQEAAKFAEQIRREVIGG